MAEDNIEITIDPLFVGLTRPATLLGIPYFATVIEFMATLIIFLAIGNPLYLLVAVPFHAILYVISAADDAKFNNIYLWMQTNSQCQNTRYWGSASFSPLSKKGKGVNQIKE